MRILIFLFLSSIGLHAQTMISLCQPILASGNYQLANDLVTSTDSTCLSIIGVPATTIIDCNQHVIQSTYSGNATVPLVSIDGSGTYPNDYIVMRNCTLSKTGPFQLAGYKATHSFVWLEYSNIINMEANTYSCQQPVFWYLNGFSATLSHSDSTYAWIYGSQINDAYLTFPVAWILQADGQFPTIQHNTIYGNFTKVDDGIILGSSITSMVNGASVRYNYISSVYDAGIEPVGNVFSSDIDSNEIHNALVSCLAWFYGSYYVGNNYSNTNCQNSGALINISGGNGQGPPISIYTDGNSVHDNVITTPSGTQAYTGIFNLYYGTEASNNVLMNNVFAGSIFLNAPNGQTTPAFVDGGGNHCNSTSGTQNGTITCLP